jgi:Ca2+-binding EF-hand superfamily protein
MPKAPLPAASALLLALLAVTAAVLAPARPVSAQPTAADLAKEWFLEHDRNHDGYITLDEAMGYEAKRFQRMDSERAGRLREDQYCAGIPTTNTAEIQRCQDRFAKIDADGDAYITLDEVQAYYGAILKAADRNQDGKVSLDEFMAATVGQ